MSVKNFNGTIGNRTSDLPACSAVPQPTAPPCAPHIKVDTINWQYIEADLFLRKDVSLRPPLWSSGQSFWLQIQRSRVRSPALRDFLSSSGSGTGSTQPREVN